MKTNYPTKKLGEVVELNYGKGITKYDRNTDGRYPIYGANGELGRSDKYLVEGKAIVIGRKGSAGEVIRVSGKFWPSDVTYYVFGNKKIDIDFLFYLLKNINLTKLAVGVKPGINRNRVYEIEIPLPPLEIQKKIVGKIEKLFAKIDEAQKLREEAKKATNTLLQSTLNEIFNKGKSKGWEEKTLGEICQIARGGSPRPIKEYLTSSDDGINWIKISDATSSTKYIYKTKEKIKKEGLKKTHLVMPGDFILTNSMSFGHPYIMKTSGAIHDGWLLLRPIKEIYSEYLYYFLGSDHIYNEFRNLAGGAVVKNLNSELVKNVKVLIPSIAEQKKIVARLDKLMEKVREMQKLQAETAAEMKNLKQSILAKAFKGEL